MYSKTPIPALATNKDNTQQVFFFLLGLKSGAYHTVCLPPSALTARRT